MIVFVALSGVSVAFWNNGTLEMKLRGGRGPLDVTKYKNVGFLEATNIVKDMWDVVSIYNTHCPHKWLDEYID